MISRFFCLTSLQFVFDYLWISPSKSHHNSGDDKANIQKAIDGLKEVLKNENASKDEIEAKIKALNDVSHKLAEAMYTKKDGESKGNESPKKDDDVIDAEVE